METIRLTGFAELERELQRLGREVTQKASLRRSARRAMEPMAELMRQLAPVAEGHLRDSITVGTRLAGGNAGRQAFGRVLRSGGSRDEALAALRETQRGEASVMMYAGPGQHPQAIMQEFGTINHPPQPFVRPAWDQDHMAMLDRLGREIRADIDRTLARQARRAARQAARG